MKQKRKTTTTTKKMKEIEEFQIEKVTRQRRHIERRVKRTSNFALDYSRERDMIYPIFGCPIFIQHYIYFYLLSFPFRFFFRCCFHQLLFVFIYFVCFISFFLSFYFIYFLQVPGISPHYVCDLMRLLIQQLILPIE